MDPEVAESLIGRLSQFMVQCPSSGPNSFTTITGIIFAVDGPAGMAVLIQPAENTTTVLNLMYVIEVLIEDKVTSAAATPSKYLCSSGQQLPATDAAQVRRRLDTVIAERAFPPQSSYCTIGGFELFCALAKQFPAYRALQWAPNNGEIIVMDDVLVSGPFDGAGIPRVGAVSARVNAEDVAPKIQRVKVIVESWTKSKQAAAMAARAGAAGQRGGVPSQLTSTQKK